jgi:hypothetical protein
MTVVELPQFFANSFACRCFSSLVDLTLYLPSAKNRHNQYLLSSRKNRWSLSSLYLWILMILLDISLENIPQKERWHLYNTCITQNKKTSIVKILVYALLVLNELDFTILEHFQNHSKKLILNHARLPVPPHPQCIFK